MITLNDIHLKLEGPAGRVKVLRGINLSIAEGETVSVVGPSGSGKTTMLMVIAGLERATSGTANVNNIDLDSLTEDQLAQFRRETMGIVFQNFHLIPTMSALENVAIPFEFSGVDDAFERALQGLESVGLGHRIHHYPGQLSGGEQQRVALARAFSTNPRILLADEPTGNLDQDTSDAIIDLLFSLTDQHNTTLLLISHDAAIGKRCQREIQIIDGRISDEGNS